MTLHARALHLLGMVLSVFQAGCSVFSTSEREVPLHEYLMGINDQVRWRDEAAWLRCFVAFKNNEPYIISIMAAKEGRAEIDVTVKTKALDKTTSKAEGKLTDAPEIGVSGSREAETTSENSLTTRLVFLDPARHRAVYQQLNDVFQKHDIDKVCVAIPAAQWDPDKAYEDGWWPTTRSPLTDRYYGVDDTTRKYFYALLNDIHGIDNLISSPSQPVAGAPTSAPSAATPAGANQ